MDWRLFPPSPQLLERSLPAISRWWREGIDVSFVLRPIGCCGDRGVSGRRAFGSAVMSSGCLAEWGALCRSGGSRAIRRAVNPCLESFFRRKRSCGRQPGRRSNKVISAAEWQDERRGNRSCSIPGGGLVPFRLPMLDFFIAACESLAPTQRNARCTRSQAWFGRRGGWRPNCLFLRDRVF